MSAEAIAFAALLVSGANLGLVLWCLRSYERCRFDISIYSEELESLRGFTHRTFEKMGRDGDE